MDQTGKHRHVTRFVNNQKEINSYTFLKELGQGAFGEVFLAKKGQKSFAIKAYNHKKVNKNIHSETLKEMIDNEMNFLKSFDHPNIIKVHETFLSENNLYLVMDFISGGDVYSKVINSGTLLSEAEAVELLRDITKAMYFASQEGIKHRDIKPENILIQGLNYILADFGVSKTSCSFLNTSVGTRPYMPPQILSQEKYSAKCDVWSLGITVYILLFGEDPFGRYKIKDKGLSQIRESRIEKDFCGSQIVFPSKPSTSAGLKLILQSMLEYDEADRASWAQLKADLHNLTGVFSTDSIKISETFTRQYVQDTQAVDIVNANLASDKNLGDYNRIKQAAAGLKDSSDEINGTEILNIVKVGHSLQSESDLDSIEKFLLLKTRLCNLYLSLIFQIKELSCDKGLEEFKGWMSSALALLCKKLTEVCEYCFHKLSGNEKFTSFLSNPFHQNGFAKQYLKEFYNLNQNCGPLQEEAVQIANSILSDQLEHKKVIIEVASAKGHHPRFRNIYKLVAHYFIKKLEVFKKGNKLTPRNVMFLEQIIGWIYSVDTYDDQLLNTAKNLGAEDGFNSLINDCENPSVIRDTYLKAKNLYFDQAPK